MMLTEFDEEKYEAIIRAEGRQEGIAIGIEEGIIRNLCTLVSKKTITMKQALDECGLTKAEFLEKCRNTGWINSLTNYEKSPKRRLFVLFMRKTILPYMVVVMC